MAGAAAYRGTESLLLVPELPVWIVRNAAQRQVPRQGCSSRHFGRPISSIALPQPFVIAEEEGFILLDGSPDRAPKLVALERGDRAGPTVAFLIEVTIRIQDVVAEKLKGRAMHGVGARPRDCRDRPA